MTTKHIALAVLAAVCATCSPSEPPIESIEDLSPDKLSELDSALGLSTTGNAEAEELFQEARGIYHPLTNSAIERVFD